MSGPFDHIVVLDFEATCKPGTPPDPQEIIEFPSVLVSLEDFQVVDSFTSFVRPVHHPQLSDFCTELTSIQQSDVDAAPPFLDVYASHKHWLSEHGLLAPGPPQFVFVTCGDWDLATMLPAQCAASSLPLTALPQVYRRWCNIKKLFGAAFLRDKGFGMPTMLRSLGLELEGRHHRGIDDCHNIARIALALAERGTTFDVTAQLPASRYPALPLVLQSHDDSRAVVLHKRSLPSLLGLASGEFHSKVASLLLADGTPLTDDLLLDLPPNTTLQIVRHRKPT